MMVKKLLVLLAASAIVSFACMTVLGMIGGFAAWTQGGPWNGWGPWNDGRYGRDPGPETTRDLPYSGSTRLDIGYPAEITYTQGERPKFTVTGPQRVIDELRLEDGDLTGPGGRDGPRFGWGRRSGGRLRIEITAPNLHEFHLAGAQKLSVRNYDQDELRIYGAGASDIEGEGKARRLEVDISGAGHVNLEELPVDDARVSISGAGDASLDARRSSDVSLSGAGHVEFKCRPTDSHSHTSGFGSVDYGSDCASLPAPPATSSEPAAPAQPAAPAPKSKV